MKLKMVSVVVVLVVLFAVSMSEVQAQGLPDADKFWIRVYGAPPASSNMSFGNRITNTTSGIDNAGTFPTEYKEQEAPPPTPGFDAVWGPVRSSQFGPGVRGLLDRQFNEWPNTASRDTFRINFAQADNGDQDISFKWADAAHINARCDSLKMIYFDPNLGSNVTIDMTTTDTLVIPAAGTNGVTFLRIFKYGGFKIDTDVKPENGLPTTFSLNQNYPNPFNPSTKIVVALPQNAHLELAVYNLLGQKIATVANENRQAGYPEYTWNGTTDNGTPVTSGVYFARLDARTEGTGESFTAMRKLLLMK